MQKELKNHPSHEIKEDYFSFSTNKKLNKDKFEEFVKKIPKEIYRAKGFVKTDKGSFLFNYVNGRFNFEKFKADKTELVFIGKRLGRIEGKIVKSLRES